MTWEIKHGDCLEVLRDMPDESAQCCVTSPPYWGLRDYGVEGQLGLERTPEEYIAKMVSVFREVRRVLKSDGTLWLDIGDCYATGAGKVGECPGGGERGARWAGDVDRLRDAKRGYRADRLTNGRGDQSADLRKKTRATRDGTHAGKHTAISAIGPMTQPNRMPLPGLKPKDLVGIPWMLAFSLRADGWYLRQDIIWSKPNPMPESVRDRCTKSHEYIFLLTKSQRYYYDQVATLEPATSAEEIVWAGEGNGLHSGEAHIGARTKRFRPVGPNAFRGAGANRDIETGAANREGRDMNETAGGIMRNKRSVWSISTKAYSEAHFATFPPEIPELCIKAGTKEGDTVLDPFNGAGTTGLVATRLMRNYVGIELNAEYITIAQRRIEQDAPLFNIAEGIGI